MRWIEATLNAESGSIDDICYTLSELGVGGMTVEDEADFRDFLENNRQYWDYVDEELARSFSGRARIKFYAADDDEGRALISAVRGAGFELETGFIEDSDWANNWDFPDKEKKDYSILLEKKIKPQLKELLTKYGDLLCIWCDDPCEITERQSKEVYEFIKSCQPDCLVPSRVGNGLGDIHSFEDNKLPDKDFEGLGEACVTMNHTWGYKGFDNDYKSADEILRIKKEVNDHGVNLLLNVSPDYLGRIPAPQVEILKEIGEKSKTEMK